MHLPRFPRNDNPSQAANELKHDELGFDSNPVIDRRANKKY